jgi:hypothetical protein
MEGSGEWERKSRKLSVEAIFLLSAREDKSEGACERDRYLPLGVV